jgi:16S rRNA C1402 N4-methylase RsmH
MPTLADIRKPAGAAPAMVTEAFNALRIIVADELGQAIETLPENTELGPRGSGALRGFMVYARSQG